VFNVGKFVGVGRNKRIAKCTAAKRALRALKVLDDEQAKRRAEMEAEQAAYEAEIYRQSQQGFGQSFQFGGAFNADDGNGGDDVDDDGADPLVPIGPTLASMPDDDSLA